MAWITLTTDDLKRRMSVEYAAITRAALNEGQDADTMVSEELANTTVFVRGFCGKGTLGETGTIPDELTDPALALLVVKIIRRLPIASKTLLSEARLTAAAEAIDVLKMVASGTFKVVRPETPASDSQQAAASSIKTVSATPKTFTRRSLRGLF